MGTITGGGRDAARAAPGGRVRGARASLVLRRLRSAPLLPASLLVAILISVAVTTGLAGFAGRALPAAAHARLARAPATPIQISGQFGAARARADESVIRSSLRSALGAFRSRWPAAAGRISWPCRRRMAASQPPQIQAAVLSGVRAHAS